MQLGKFKLILPFYIFRTLLKRQQLISPIPSSQPLLFYTTGVLNRILSTRPQAAEPGEDVAWILPVLS